MDTDYWKRRYGPSWVAASEREQHVKDLIEKQTGQEVEFVGLGAGSTDFLSGSAQSHGVTRGGADLHIVGTNIWIEVTGPQVRVSDDAPLWIRPDKVNAARSQPQHDTWVVHCSYDNEVMRVIRLSKDFFMGVDNGSFGIINPTIRGARETYVAVPASSSVVRPFFELIQHIIKVSEQ